MKANSTQFRMVAVLAVAAAGLTALTGCDRREVPEPMPAPIVTPTPTPNPMPDPSPMTAPVPLEPASAASR